MKNNMLNNTTVEIEKEENLKQNFFSQISYGIRTPLNSIMGFSKLLLYSDFKDVQKNNEFAKRIIQSSNSLLKFVDDVIELSKIEASEYEVNSMSYGLNSFLWEIHNDYNKQVFDSNIDDNTILELTIDKSVKECYFNTDKFFLRKLIFRIIDILHFYDKYNNIELAYRYIDDDKKLAIIICTNFFNCDEDNCKIEKFCDFEDPLEKEETLTCEVVRRIAHILNINIVKETDSNKNIQYKLIFL